MPTTQPVADTVYAIAIGLAVALLGGAAFIMAYFEVVGCLLGQRATRASKWLSCATGIIERIIYFFGALVGAWELVGGWLVLKSLNKFSEQGQDGFLKEYYPYLMGNGLSLIFGVGGAVLARALGANIAAF
jgi:integral membrane sensor domain MASE1